MSQMDELISGINPNRRSPNKEELWGFVKESLEQIGQINGAYKKYFESPDEQDSLTVFQDIEHKVEKIKESYADLFNSSPEAISKINDLNEKVEKIKEYHAQLLEGDESVQSDIDGAHEKISDFYEYLFGAEEEDDNGIEPEVKEAIKLILEKKKIISDFEKHLNEKIKPSLDEIQKDLQTKRKEVGSLLSNATASTLANAYAESKHEYSIPAEKKYEKGVSLKNFGIFLFNRLGRYIGNIFNYAIFILPLVSVSLIFTSEKVATIVLDSLTEDQYSPSPLELIYVKTLISVPLIWIAWYGQRNISHRKRLSEEYNHKQRVVQMYLMFVSDEQSTYELNNKEKLEDTLLEAIARNPSEVYGRDETMLDRIANIFLAKKGILDEAVSEVKKVTKIDK